MTAKKAKELLDEQIEETGMYGDNKTIIGLLCNFNYTKEI